MTSGAGRPAILTADSAAMLATSQNAESAAALLTFPVPEYQFEQAKTFLFFSIKFKSRKNVFY